MEALSVLGKACSLEESSSSEPLFSLEKNRTVIQSENLQPTFGMV